MITNLRCSPTDFTHISAPPQVTLAAATQLRGRSNPAPHVPPVCAACSSSCCPLPKPQPRCILPRSSQRPSTRLMAFPLAQTAALCPSLAGAPAPAVACSGYVGQGAKPAAEYHECDFDWDEHAHAVRHLVEEQQAKALALRALEASALTTETVTTAVLIAAGGAQTAALSSAVSPPSQSPHHQQQPAADGLRGHLQGWGQGPDTPAVQAPPTTTAARTRSAAHTATATATATPADKAEAQGIQSASTAPQQLRPTLAMQHGSVETTPLTPPSAPPANVAAAAAATATVAPCTTPNDGPPPPPDAAAIAAYEGSRWEEFYRSHPSARFFKERRYLLLEFPELLMAQHVVEIGAGCGSSILPVLKANPRCRTTCTDISTTCLDQLLAAAHAEGIARERVAVFPADATDPADAAAFEGLAADALLIMFTLSAVTPAQQLEMLRHAWRALRPGGRLMIRDHGLYDMVQLRIPAEQWVGPNLYKRGDGTMAYFFATDDLAGRAAAAGFTAQECKYVTVVNRNRKTGAELRRVFVHGVFIKPEQAERDASAGVGA